MDKRLESEDMKPTRVLYVGGSKDGQWGEVTETVVYHTKPMTFTPMDFTKPESASLEVPLPEREMYSMDEINLAGYRLRLMVCHEDLFQGKNRGDLILRAILQRDVAKELGVK